MDQMAHYTQQMRRAVVLRETIHALHTPQRPLNERAVMLGDKSIDGGRARSMLSQCGPSPTPSTPSHLHLHALRFQCAQKAN